MFPPNIWKNEREIFSFLSSNYSYEGMEFTFDKGQIADVFLQIDQRPYAKNPKWKTRQTISLTLNDLTLKIRNQKQDKLLAFPESFVLCKRLLWPPTMQFRQTCPGFRPEIVIKSVQTPKKVEHVIFFPQNVPVEKYKAVLTILPFFVPKVQFCSAHHQRRKKLSKTFLSQVIHLDTYRAVPKEMPPNN